MCDSVTTVSASAYYGHECSCFVSMRTNVVIQEPQLALLSWEWRVIVWEEARQGQDLVSS